MSSMSPPPLPKPPPQPTYPGAFAGSGMATPSTASYGQPPAKRQRLSPDPRSPPGSFNTTFATNAQQQQQQQLGGPVTSAYGNPYAQHSPQTTPSPQSYLNGPHNSFHTPQPYPFQQMPWQASTGAPVSVSSPLSAGARQNSPPSQQSREMMPPPPRPNREDRDEKAGVEEIGDSLYGSGINLKDEENYMHTVYNNRHAGDSFNSNQNTSFGSTVLSPNNSFNVLTQGTLFGSQETTAALQGTMGQPQSQEDIELEYRRKREAAARARAQRMQHHLNNQFLLCNNVRKRLDMAVRSHGIAINLSGLWLRNPDTSVAVSDGATAGVAAIHERLSGGKFEDRLESTVDQGAAFEHVLALISLATGERLRGLIDESFALARARRYGDHGRVVPPDFSDIAEGEGKETVENIVPENITGSQWDKVPGSSPKDTGTQNGDDADRLTPQSQRTQSFQGTLSARLRELAERDKQAEKERIKKREARKRAADATAHGDPATADTPGTDTPMANGMAEPPAPVKISKKEQAKQQKDKSTLEAQSHNTVNQTAAMMALGRKGNRYSWMSGGAANLPTNRFAKPVTNSSVNSAATPSEDAKSPAPTVSAVKRATNGDNGEGRWGDWREERVDGQGVQLRDWVLVLERDGREKAALQKALWKLS